MNKQSQSLFDENIFRPAWIEIDLDAIKHNYQQIRNHLQTQILAVVKADAYGLGAVPISRTLEKAGVDRLGVVMLDEAVELRNAGIQTPIVNMGSFLASLAPLVVKHDIEQVVYKVDDALALSNAAVKANKTLPIHFKIDTGMSRYGVHFSQAVDTLLKISSFPNLEIRGIMTHFPVSDAIDKSFALLQIERMRHIKKQLDARNINIPIWHMANSGATLDIPASHLNMVRVGLMFYGYYPSDDVVMPYDLKPAMSLKAKIVNVKNISRGDTVGYGRRFLAEKDERIGILPMGYSDGYDRKIGRNGGEVLIHGKRVPIISGLCMDAFFIKLTDFPDVHEGDTVVIMGFDRDEEISPHEIATKTGSVSYEVISNFSKRLPRVYLQNGEITEIKNYLINH